MRRSILELYISFLEGVFSTFFNGDVKGLQYELSIGLVFPVNYLVKNGFLADDGAFP